MPPFALIANKDLFSEYKSVRDESNSSGLLKREKVIEIILGALNQESIVVSTTGMASREIFELREASGQVHDSDFMTVGGMGHSSQIALGVSIFKPNRSVVCIDGDGAALMHMGSFAINGTRGGKNFRHLILNNGAHDSVGGQATAAFDVDLCGMANSMGYNVVGSVSSEVDIKVGLERFLRDDGPIMLEIKIGKGARSDLGRPTTTPLENRDTFMRNLV